MKNILSVIMPVYNTKKELLVEAIDSVFNQTYSDFEFIIVDDGSNIETKNILKQYESKCKIIHQER